MPEKTTTLLFHWFRRDLRLDANQALFELIDTARQMSAHTASIGVVLVYAHSRTESPRAQEVWLNQSLIKLQSSLHAKLDLPLQYTDQDWPETLAGILAQQRFANCVLSFNQLYEPKERTKEQEIRKVCQKFSCKVIANTGNYLLEPGKICTDSGVPYKIFSPFYKRATNLLNCDNAPPLPTGSLRDWHIDLNELTPYQRLTGLDQNKTWVNSLRQHCQAGEENALNLWQEFTNEPIKIYGADRAHYAKDSTSRLSAHIHFGEISVHAMCNDICQHLSEGYANSAAQFLRSLIWREFNISWLHYQPDLLNKPLRKNLHFHWWENDPELLNLWKSGQTGYPVVDAAMNQLRHTGWMHNRLRMVVASFLIKDLMIDWLIGQEWFLENLFDADEANNAMSWQSSAGAGLNSMPFFRIFNPTRQSHQFDPDGSYIRRWLPALADYRGDSIHEPSPQERKKYSYPPPCVDHKKARQKALNAWRTHTVHQKGQEDTQPKLGPGLDPKVNPKVVETYKQQD